MYDFCALKKLVVDLRRFEQQVKVQSGLSLNEAICLCQIHCGTTEPKKLAKTLEVSPSRLSRILDSLQDRSLLMRDIACDDRRTIVIRLTEKGRQITQSLDQLDIPMPHSIKAYLSQLGETQ